METTLGVDLASQPRHTALCVIAWHDSRAEVRALAHGRWHGTALHDKLLPTAIRGLWGVEDGWGRRGHPAKTAIDAPFGWPKPFVHALEAHHRLEPWPEILDKLTRALRAPRDRSLRPRACAQAAAVGVD